MKEVKINKRFLVQSKKALRELRDRNFNMDHWSAIEKADEELPYFKEGFTNEQIISMTLPDSVVGRLNELKQLLERLGFNIAEDFVA